MTPPTAATAAAGRTARPGGPQPQRSAGHRRTVGRTQAPARPRRFSGPAARPAIAGAGRGPAGALGGAATIALPLGARVGQRLRNVPDAPILDRLIRGRAWIAIVAVALMGLVFLQVSLLKLNTGISHAVVTAQTLERQNTVLRNANSRLGAGQRIEDAATRAGMVLPAAGQYRYLDARKVTAAQAAAGITAPHPVVQQPASALTSGSPQTTAANGANTGSALAGTTPAAGIPSAASTAPATTAQASPTAATTPAAGGAATTQQATTATTP